MARVKPRIPNDMLNELLQDLEALGVDLQMHESGERYLLSLDQERCTVLVGFTLYREDDQYYADATIAGGKWLTVNRYRDPDYSAPVKIDEDIRLGADPTTLYSIVSRVEDALELAASEMIVVKVGTFVEGIGFTLIDRKLVETSKEAEEWFEEYDFETAQESQETYQMRPLTAWEGHLFRQ